MCRGTLAEWKAPPQKSESLCQKTFSKTKPKNKQTNNSLAISGFVMQLVVRGGVETHPIAQGTGTRNLHQSASALPKQQVTTVLNDVYLVQFNTHKSTNMQHV